jgi:hypothetical protein
MSREGAVFPNREYVMPGNWRKSSRSGQDGDCVEAGSAAGMVFVRDTADRAGPVLVFTAGQWRVLTGALKE